MYTKMLGFVLLPLSGYLFGCSQIHMLIQTKEILEQYERMLLSLSQMAEWGYNCSDMLQKLREHGNTARKLMLYSHETLREYTLPSCIPQEIRQKLNGIFPLLGKLQVEQLQTEIEHYIVDAENIIHNIDNNLCKAKQLYSKICFWGSLAAAILLL